MLPQPSFNRVESPVKPAAINRKYMVDPAIHLQDCRRCARASSEVDQDILPQGVMQNLDDGGSQNGIPEAAYPDNQNAFWTTVVAPGTGIDCPYGIHSVLSQARVQSAPVPTSI